MKRLVALSAVLATICAGLVTLPASVAATAKARPAKEPIAWGECSNPRLQQAHAECGFLSVPLDYANPGGHTIKLAVSRVVHKTPDSEYQGPMLVNPGGPGGSGLVLSILGEFIPKHAGDAYDWIGFDPRGVGSSVPAISCVPKYFGGDRPPYVPTKPAFLAAWQARSKGYAKACGKDAHALLQHMKTTDAARDMDSIRVALGAAQINYYGFSYGTYLGQVYTTLFPTHVRRMVLDSNVDPRNVWYRANLNQDVAFERNINIWFGWVAKYDSVYHLGKTGDAVRKLFVKEEAALRQQPAGGVVGPDEWDDAFLLAGYYQFFWTQLGDVFSSWVHNHDAAKLIAAYQNAVNTTNDNGFAVYLAVECSDVQWPQAWSKWARDNWRTYGIAPFYTWGNAWFNAPCLYWPAEAGTPVTIDGGKVPALLIDETLDAATPFAGSLEVRRRFPASSLISEPGGTTHAGTLGGNACVDNQIADYLLDGTLPPRQPGDRADTRCKPLPQPVPGAAPSSPSSALRMEILSKALVHR